MIAADLKVSLDLNYRQKTDPRKIDETPGFLERRPLKALKK
jgi:hypothetical protein